MAGGGGREIVREGGEWAREQDVTRSDSEWLLRLFRGETEKYICHVGCV